MGRRKGNSWYVGGISAERSARNKTVSLNFLSTNTSYKLTLISDGEHDKKIVTQYSVVDKSSTIKVRVLGRGGFVALLVPIEK